MANAEMIRHVTLRREKFPKWTASYGILRQFGENVLTSKGQVWRTHRKVTSASFNERNAALVFREAILQTQGMLQTWTDAASAGEGPLRSVERDTMRLALNIIGYVGFGLRLLWPGLRLLARADRRLAKYASLEAPAGHKLSFVDTMSSVMDNILLLLVTPKRLLRALPVRRAQVAADAYGDYIKYMDEMMEDKIDEARKGGGRASEGMDLMGQLARATYGREAGDEGKAKLTRDENIGNAFIMFVAGHKTTANTLHFAMVQLATHPGAQQRLQRDIDELVGDADPGAWRCEGLVKAPTASMVGACMFETRVMPPPAELPKEVAPGQDQAISMDGRWYVIPRGIIVSLAGVSMHLNPRSWLHGASRLRVGEDDLRDFRLERWLEAGGSGGGGHGLGGGPGRGHGRLGRRRGPRARRAAALPAGARGVHPL